MKLIAQIVLYKKYTMRTCNFGVEIKILHESCPNVHIRAGQAAPAIFVSDRMPLYYTTHPPYYYSAGDIVRYCFQLMYLS